MGQWEGLGTVSNAIRDLLERRNEESHRSPDPSNEDVAQQTWGTLVVILELVGMGLLVVSLGLLHRQTQRAAPPRLGY